MAPNFASNCPAKDQDPLRRIMRTIKKWNNKRNFDQMKISFTHSSLCVPQGTQASHIVRLAILSFNLRLETLNSHLRKWDGFDLDKLIY